MNLFVFRVIYIRILLWFLDLEYNFVFLDWKNTGGGEENPSMLSWIEWGSWCWCQVFRQRSTRIKQSGHDVLACLCHYYYLLLFCPSSFVFFPILSDTCSFLFVVLHSFCQRIFYFVQKKMAAPFLITIKPILEISDAILSRAGICWVQISRCTSIRLNLKGSIWFTECNIIYGNKIIKI